MRQSSSLFPLAVTFVAGFFFVALVFLVPSFAAAAEASKKDNQACSCPAAPPAALDDKPWRKNKFAKITIAPNHVARLTVRDRIAAMEIIQVALSRVPDGSTYVWHRGHGKLSGIVNPTGSFKKSDGQICRHFIVMYASGVHTRKTETIACRLENGIWRMDG